MNILTTSETKSLFWLDLEVTLENEVCFSRRCVSCLNLKHSLNHVLRFIFLFWYFYYSLTPNIKKKEISMLLTTKRMNTNKKFRFFKK